MARWLGTWLRDRVAPGAPPVPAGASDPAERPTGRRSYSIEAEDLLIERLLAVARPASRSRRYLDIGGFHPVHDSNTFRFYEQGWRGVVVEPNPAFTEPYAALRPEDTLVGCGLSADGGVLRYHQFEQGGLNGFYGQDIVDHHLREGQRYLGHRDVPCLPVRQFLNEHPGPYDFMDIDIETVELELLRVWDWTLCRPTVICVEIHSFDMLEMLGGEVARLLMASEYRPMSRGWQSSMFVAAESLAYLRG